MRQIPVDTGDLTSSIDVESITIWSFVWAVVIVAVSFLLAAGVRRLVRRALVRLDGVPDSYRLLIARASGWFVIVIGLLYALGVLGVDIGPAVVALLLIAAVAFFAGRGLLENFSAGLVLQGTEMFGVGDQIETADGAGTVVEITGRTVVIQTPDGKEINLPNSMVVNNPVINLTKIGERRTTISVGVAYGTDLDEAREAIREAAGSCDLVLADPEPDALITEFGDDAINIDCRFWHRPTILEERRASDQVARAISRALAERDIEIAFPQRTLWWGEGQG